MVEDPRLASIDGGAERRALSPSWSAVVLHGQAQPQLLSPASSRRSLKAAVCTMPYVSRASPSQAPLPQRATIHSHHVQARPCTNAMVATTAAPASSPVMVTRSVSLGTVPQPFALSSPPCSFRFGSPPTMRIQPQVTLGSPRGCSKTADTDGTATSSTNSAGADRTEAATSSRTDTIACLSESMDEQLMCEVPSAFLKGVMEQLKRAEEERMKLACTVEALGRRTEEASAARLQLMESDRREIEAERESLRAERLGALEAAEILEEARRKAVDAISELRHERQEAQRVTQELRNLLSSSPGARTPAPESTQVTCRMVHRSVSEGSFIFHNVNDNMGLHELQDTNGNDLVDNHDNISLEAPTEDATASRRVSSTSSLVSSHLTPPSAGRTDVMIPKLALSATRSNVEPYVVAKLDDGLGKYYGTKPQNRAYSPGVRRCVPPRAFTHLNPRDSVKKVPRTPLRQSCRSPERHVTR